MTARYEVTRPAARDLNQIWDYYDEVAGEEVADRQIGRIESRFLLIAENPYIGVLRTEYGPDVRTYRVPNLPYVIIYKVSGGVIEITRVVHGRRNLRRLFG